MRPFHAAVMGCSALALSACATRGAIDVACPAFDRPADKMVFELPQSRLAREIQQEANGGSIDVLSPPDDDKAFVPGEDPLADAIAAKIRAAMEGKSSDALQAEPPTRALLLSGGGQWGSFGAGFLHQLYEDQGAAALDYQLVTGVSTGGLQAIFVAVGNDEVSNPEKERFEKFLAERQIPWAGGPDDDKVRYIDLLQMNYSPAAEDEIVNRNAKELSVITGSFAGLKPLRKRIERALCPNDDKAKPCPLIEALRNSKASVYIGFVRADDGKFMVADAVKLANLSGGDRGYGVARDCLTGAALASAAMPVTFQQVRVEERTMLDGGVRKSVFDERITKSFAKALEEVFREKSLEARPVELDVIRNGPTVMGGGRDGSVNKTVGIDKMAERGQSIVVNELEVGSIAALRLERPTGPIRLITADGFDGTIDGWDEVCKKSSPEVMFDPTFMTCLRKFGRFKAKRRLGEAPGSPWLTLSEIGQPQKDNGE